jgi:tetraacyldisaccharide-1-P 4'-kinase
MKLARLFQPRNPLFWMMVALNLLSAVLAWLTRTHALDAVGSLLVTVFAIGNAVLGTYLAWRLMRS